MEKKDLIILAVDDDKINLKLLKSLLVKDGIVKEIIETHNGLDAIEVIKSRDDIDLIFLDIVMPIMDGLEMLQRVRADKSIKQVPIIIQTTDETKKNEVLKHGANGFLTKPIRNIDLIKEIEALD